MLLDQKDANIKPSDTHNGVDTQAHGELDGSVDRAEGQVPQLWPADHQIPEYFRGLLRRKPAQALSVALSKLCHTQIGRRLKRLDGNLAFACAQHKQTTRSHESCSVQRSQRAARSHEAAPTTPEGEPLEGLWSAVCMG